MAASGPSSIGRTIDVGEFINGRKLTSFNVLLVVVSWLITVFDGFDQMTVSYTMPYMRDVLHLTSGMQGNVFAIGNFGMMAGGFFFVFLGDRIGRRATGVGAGGTLPRPTLLNRL